MMLLQNVMSTITVDYPAIVFIIVFFIIGITIIVIIVTIIQYTLQLFSDRTGPNNNYSYFHHLVVIDEPNIEQATSINCLNFFARYV